MVATRNDTWKDFFAQLDKCDFGFRCSAEKLRNFLLHPATAMPWSNKTNIEKATTGFISHSSNIIAVFFDVRNVSSSKSQLIFQFCQKRAIPTIIILPHHCVGLPRDDCLAIALRQTKKGMKKNKENYNKLIELVSDTAQVSAAMYLDACRYAENLTCHRITEVGSFEHKLLHDFLDLMKSTSPSCISQSWDQADPTTIGSKTSPRLVVVSPYSSFFQEKVKNAIVDIFEYQRILALEGVPCFISCTQEGDAAPPVVVTHIPDSGDLNLMFQDLSEMACLKQTCHPQEENLVIQAVKSQTADCVRIGLEAVKTALETETVRLVVVDVEQVQQPSYQHEDNSNGMDALALIKECRSKGASFVTLADWSRVETLATLPRNCHCLCILSFDLDHIGEGRSRSGREDKIADVCLFADTKYINLLDSWKERRILDMMEGLRHRPSKFLSSRAAKGFNGSSPAVSSDIREQVSGCVFFDGREDGDDLFTLAKSSDCTPLYLPLKGNDSSRIMSASLIVIRVKELENFFEDKTTLQLFRRIAEASVPFLLLQTATLTDSTRAPCYVLQNTKNSSIKKQFFGKPFVNYFDASRQSTLVVKEREKTAFQNHGEDCESSRNSISEAGYDLEVMLPKCVCTGGGEALREFCELDAVTVTYIQSNPDDINKIKEMEPSSIVVILSKDFQRNFSRIQALQVLRNIKCAKCRFIVYARRPARTASGACFVMNRNRKKKVSAKKVSTSLYKTLISYQKIPDSLFEARTVTLQRGESDDSTRVRQEKAGPTIDHVVGSDDTREQGKMEEDDAEASVKPGRNVVNSEKPCEGVGSDSPCKEIGIDSSCKSTVPLQFSTTNPMVQRHPVEGTRFTNTRMDNDDSESSRASTPANGAEGDVSCNRSEGSRSRLSLRLENQDSELRSMIALEEEEIALQSAVYDLTARIEAVEDAEGEAQDNRVRLQDQIFNSQSEVERLALTLDLQQAEHASILSEIAEIEAKLQVDQSEMQETETGSTEPTTAMSFSSYDEAADHRIDGSKDRENDDSTVGPPQIQEGVSGALSVGSSEGDEYEHKNSNAAVTLPALDFEMAESMDSMDV